MVVIPNVKDGLILKCFSANRLTSVILSNDTP
jgi:hypothetical protein